MNSVLVIWYLTHQPVHRDQKAAGPVLGRGTLSAGTCGHLRYIAEADLCNSTNVLTKKELITKKQIGHHKDIRLPSLVDEGPTLETSALESLYGGQCTFSYQLC